MTRLSRRKFILTAGSAALGTAILHGCTSPGNQTTTNNPTETTTPSNTNTPTGETPEVTSIKLGFIALTDSAPCG